MRSYIKKICICGDPAVGKTSLTRRFVTGDYNTKYITTLGTVITKKLVEFPEKDVSMNMQIWDISGQAEFKRIHASAFRYAEAAFVVCDILHPETAASVYTWISNLHKYSHDGIPIIVLVNKYDLVERKEKNVREIVDILNELDYPVFAVSAKTGHNVDLGFEILAERLIPLPTRLPIKAEEMVAMPEIFENPFEFLDYALVRYTKTFGDTEMSIHLIRKEMESKGKQFNEKPKDEAMKMIDKLTGIIYNFKGVEEGNKLREEFMKAYNRTHW